MKTSLLITYLCTFCLALTLSAKEFEQKTELLSKTIIKKGESVKFKITLKYPETYQVSAWNTQAYLPNLPENFCKVMNLTPTVNKDPKWSSVPLHPWKWLPLSQRTSKEIECDISTINWPEGDYRVSCTVLFQQKEKSSNHPDQYLASSITFTIEE